MNERYTLSPALVVRLMATALKRGMYEFVNSTLAGNAQEVAALDVWEKEDHLAIVVETKPDLVTYLAISGRSEEKITFKQLSREEFLASYTAIPQDSDKLATLKKHLGGVDHE